MCDASVTEHDCAQDDVLELARGDTGFGAGVMDICAGEFELGGDAEHALERIQKENADEAATGVNGGRWIQRETYMNEILRP